MPIPIYLLAGIFSHLLSGLLISNAGLRDAQWEGTCKLKKSTLMKGVAGVAILASTPVTMTAKAAVHPAADVNLALGKSYTVSTPITDPLLSTDESNWFPSHPGILTDGKNAQPVFYPIHWIANPDWDIFMDQNSRSIVVDLGKTDTVHKITADFLNDPANYTFLPPHAILSVSIDGTHWERVGDVTPPVPLTAQATENVLYAQDHLNIQARYVRLDFSTDDNVAVDEIQVLGQPGVQPGAKRPHETPHQIARSAGYATLKQSGGVNDMLLTPLWLSSNYDQSRYPWNLTAKQWLPMIAYIDKQGQIKNWLFRSIIAWPGAGSTSATQQDWQTWMDHIFSTGPYQNTATATEFPALDQAVGEAKAALHDPHYQENVIVSIPYPDPSVSNWGTVNGKTLNFSNPIDRQTAVDWFIQQVVRQWRQSHYKNLRLAGFYWYNEDVNVHINGELSLLQHTSRVIHSHNLRFYWIPYFEAPGYRIWRQLGFDVAMMQPNYAFNSNPVERLSETAELAKQYGLGVELEFPYAVTDPSAAKGTNQYLQYQDAALQYGFSRNVPLAWYQNTQGVLTDYLQNRMVYDLVNEFIQGTYTPQAYQPTGSGNDGKQYVLRPVQPQLPAFEPLHVPAGLDVLNWRMFR
jgi:hypothetical protein